MVRCDCGKVWLWDWCGDLYRYENGSLVNTEEWEAECIDQKIFLSVCTCGRVNSITLDGDMGMGIINRPEWKEVNWESHENCYPEALGHHRRSKAGKVLDKLAMAHLQYSFKEATEYKYLTDEEKTFISPEDFDLIKGIKQKK